MRHRVRVALQAPVELRDAAGGVSYEWQTIPELADVAATIGRDFTFDVLAQTSDSPEDDVLTGLEELGQRQIVREHGANIYDFSHDKIREVAYMQISATRRRRLHRRIAQALEIVHTANLDQVSSQLAAHYEKGGVAAQAILYYQRAAQTAKIAAAVIKAYLATLGTR